MLQKQSQPAKFRGLESRDVKIGVLEFVDTKNQLVDILTKPLPKETFFAIRIELGLLDINNLDK